MRQILLNCNELEITFVVILGKPRSDTSAFTSDDLYMHRIQTTVSTDPSLDAAWTMVQRHDFHSSRFRSSQFQLIFGQVSREGGVLKIDRQSLHLSVWSLNVFFYVSRDLLEHFLLGTSALPIAAWALPNCLSCTLVDFAPHDIPTTTTGI